MKLESSSLTGIQYDDPISFDIISDFDERIVVNFKNRCSEKMRDNLSHYFTDLEKRTSKLKDQYFHLINVIRKQKKELQLLKKELEMMDDSHNPPIPPRAPGEC